MYRILKAEMVRTNVQNSELASILGVNLATISRKMNRKDGFFSLDEAIKVKKALGVQMPLEDLFKWED